MAKGIRLTIEDLETGSVETKEIPAGECFLLTVNPCWCDGMQVYKNGTIIYTVKGRTQKGVSLP